MITNRRKIHIMARDIVQRDAVGNYCLQTGNYLKSDGWDVTFWADHFRNIDLSNDIQNFMRSEFLNTAQSEDILIYHFSIGDPFLRHLKNFSGTKILYFHNITPPDIIDPSDELTRANCQMGYDQLGLLTMFDAVFANSKYTAELLPNLTELNSAKLLEILPPVADISRWNNIEQIETNNQTETSQPDTNLIYVGRLVPNKGIEKLLHLFDYISRLGNYMLNIVGGPADSPYLRACKETSQKINENSNSEIFFHHDITDEELKALYLRADGAITMSRHEGFCVPALDALFFNIPFFSTELPALSDVLGKAAIQLKTSELEKTASEIHAAYQDQNFLLEHSNLRREQLDFMTVAASSSRFNEVFRRTLAKL